MKLISLNTWGGKQFKFLMEFIEENSEDTDIFCFQEVFSTQTQNTQAVGYRLNLYQEISKVLRDFQGFHAPTQEKYIFFEGPVDFDLSWGLAIFVRKENKVKSSGDFFVYRQRNSFIEGDPTSLPRNIQYINLDINSKDLWILNIHGVWMPAPKIDIPERIKQSEMILEFLSDKQGKKIVCGDFNLQITTKSIEILEQEFKNLIKEYKVPTTRSKFYDRPNDKYADYTFVSSDVEVKSFEVPDLEVSDHLPMILEFS